MAKITLPSRGLDEASRGPGRAYIVHRTSLPTTDRVEGIELPAALSSEKRLATTIMKQSAANRNILFASRSVARWSLVCGVSLAKGTVGLLAIG